MKRRWHCRHEGSAGGKGVLAPPRGEHTQNGANSERAEKRANQNKRRHRSLACAEARTSSLVGLWKQQGAMTDCLLSQKKWWAISDSQKERFRVNSGLQETHRLPQSVARWPSTWAVLAGYNVEVYTLLPSRHRTSMARQLLTTVLCSSDNWKLSFISPTSDRFWEYRTKCDSTFVLKEFTVK